jgi:hypothetical protein
LPEVDRRVSSWTFSPETLSAMTSIRESNGENRGAVGAESVTYFTSQGLGNLSRRLISSRSEDGYFEKTENLGKKAYED